jgi:hypothetical protein
MAEYSELKNGYKHDRGEDAQLTRVNQGSQLTSITALSGGAHIR